MTYACCKFVRDATRNSVALQHVHTFIRHSSPHAARTRSNARSNAMRTTASTLGAPPHIHRARRVARATSRASRVPVSTSRTLAHVSRHAAVASAVASDVASDFANAVPYAPSPMDPAQLTNECVALGAIAGMTAYWWFVLVPSARVRLATNKRTGALRTYLEELKRDDSKDRGAERWFYAQWLSKVDPETRYLLRADAEDAEVDTVERTTTTINTTTTTTPNITSTRLNQTNGGGVRTKEPSLEDIIKAAKKTPKFWSLDNPVLVGAFLSIGAAAIVSGGPPH